MKSPSVHPISLGILLLGTALSAQAANTWTNGASNFAWDAVSANWTTPTVWTNGEDAIFDATGVGNVVVGAGVTANSLAFNTNGYTLSGSPLTLVGPSITTATGVTTTISSALGGANGLTKNGAGNLTLSGTNSYSGVTTIAAGALFAGNASGVSLPGNVTMGNGTAATFLIATASNQFSSSSVLAFAGGGQNTKFQLRGTNQTVAGLSSAATNSLSIIQNDEAATPGYTTAPGVASLTINNSTNQSFYGIIRDSSGGALSIIKEGTGTQELRNSITAVGLTYSGATTINNGRLSLNLSGANNGFNSPVTVNTNGTLGLDGNFNMGMVISGAGQVAKSGTGTVNITGATSNTYTGLTTVEDGTLVLSKTGGATAIAGNVTIGNSVGNDILRIGANEQIANTSVLTFTSAATSGNGGKMELQNFTETVAGISSASGISILQAFETGGSGTGTLIVNNNVDQTFDGIIRDGSTGVIGAFALTKTGSGRMTILNTTAVAGNTYTGATNVSSGIIQFGNSTASRKSLGNGTLQISAGATALFYYNSAVTYNNTISGSGNLDFRSTSSPTSGGGNEHVLGGANGGFSGPITVTDSRLRVQDASSRLGDASATNTISIFGNGQLMLNGAGTYNNKVTLRGLGYYETGGVDRFGALRVEAGAVQAGAVTLAANSGIGAHQAGGSISGVISDGGSGFSVTKLGNSTLTLTNANTYGGKTFVQAGTLALSGSGSIATSPEINLTAGSTLDVSATTASWSLLSTQSLTGNGAVKGNFTVAGTIAPGNSAGAITTTGAVTLNSGSIWRAELGGLAPAAYDQLSGNGSNSLASNGLIIVSLINSFVPAIGDSFILAPNFASRSGTATFDFSAASAPSGSTWDTSTFNTDGKISIVAVPELSSAALMALTLLGAMRRRR